MGLYRERDLLLKIPTYGERKGFVWTTSCRNPVEEGWLAPAEKCILQTLTHEVFR